MTVPPGVAIAFEKRPEEKRTQGETQKVSRGGEKVTKRTEKERNYSITPKIARI
jgi:hypothetical protein